MANSESNETSIQKRQSSDIVIPVQTPNGTSLEPVDDPQRLIAESKSARQGLGSYILATRPNGSWNTDFEPQLLRHLLKEHEVTIAEAIKAFKKAYSDHYTPASGIEWRHLWKHIEEMRKGRERRLYSYREMQNICDKENINTDHFERLDDIADKIQDEFPERDIKDIQCWKRL